MVKVTPCVVALLLVLSVPSRFASSSDAPPIPTFNGDVAPILFASCVTCHRPDEAAPMSLLTFADARPWARAMKAKVLAHEMPPWSADSRFGEFKNQPRLSESQVAAIVGWADAGAPEGPGNPPPPPVFPTGWNSAMGRPPDRIIEAPFDELSVPASGDVPTFTVWLRVPFKYDTFVEAMEIRPTNRRVVHHASLSLGSLPPRTRLGKASLWPGGAELNGVRLDSNGQPHKTLSNAEFGDPMLFYVPGGGFIKFPRGIGKRISADEYLSWGMHVITTGQPERVRVRLGLWFAKKTVAHEAFMVTANARKFVDGKEIVADARGNVDLPRIPPHASNWAITGTINFRDAATLYSLWPHMHLRGKDMTFTLVYPDGREETLLSVPKYNMFWQTTYELAKPVSIPAGSTIRAVAHYDNSASNRNNPAPDEEVLWGEQSWNEMFNPFMEVSIDKEDLRLERLPGRLR
jgi:hypothetical protein